MYSFTSNIRFSEVAPDRTLTLSSLINYFQDCSTFQSESLGVGFDYLEPIQRVWLLSAWQVVINRLPKLGEAVRVGTWATSFTPLTGDRNFILLDNQGEALAVANSVWVYADTVTGRPTRILPENIEAYETGDPYPMTYAPRKIPIPADFSEQEPITVTQAHLDYNKHVNNGQYIRMTETFLPENFSVGEFRADYRRSALLHDMIHPLVTITENTCTVVLADADHKPYTTVQFIRKGTSL